MKLAEKKCLEAGVDFVAIADTVGYAGPKQVGELTRAIVKMSGAKPVCIHLHDTRGMGIANASAALDAGRAPSSTDRSAASAAARSRPGATGNVVFEDLVFLSERARVFATGIDIEKLVAVRLDPAIGNAGRAALWRARPRWIAGQDFRRGGPDVPNAIELQRRHAQSQCVADDANRRQRHRGCGK